MNNAKHEDPNNPSIFNLDGLKSIENAIFNRNKRKIYSALNSIMKRKEDKYGKNKGKLKIWKSQVPHRKPSIGRNKALNCYKDKNPETGEKIKIIKPRLVANTESFYWG